MWSLYVGSLQEKENQCCLSEICAKIASSSDALPNTPVMYIGNIDQKRPDFFVLFQGMAFQND